MFRKFFEKFKPKEINDPFLGRLLFGNAKSSYWEGAGIFPATGTQIEYFIDGDEKGPGESQREFYKTFSSKYFEITKIIAPLLANEYKQWFEKIPPDNLWTIFKITSVSIPDYISDQMEWDITFESAEDSQHLFVVWMRGWSPTGKITIDG